MKTDLDRPRSSLVVLMLFDAHKSEMLRMKPVIIFVIQFGSYIVYIHTYSIYSTTRCVFTERCDVTMELTFDLDR